MFYGKVLKVGAKAIIADFLYEFCEKTQFSLRLKSN